MRRTATTLTAAAVLALAACSSTGSKATASGDHASPSATTASAAPTTPTPDPTPTTDPPLAIGATWGWQAGDGSSISGSTTVLGYQQHVAADAPTPEEALGASSHGYVWAAADIKVCNDSTSSDAIPVSSEPWSLAYADGSQIQSSSTTYDALPKPAFPLGDTQVQPGRCLRGKIVFAVPAKGRPADVVYAPSGLDKPQMWAVAPH